MTAWYNENDPYAAQWLRNLIAAGEIPAGEVDDRSILDVRAADLASFTECHFFAGIGGWPLALQLAGWTADRPVWSGSCPCQPFSSAGQRLGADDARHLWPAWFHLIEACRPAVIFGEQVASSLVIGPADEQDEDVQDLLDREAVLGILYELQRGDPQGLQGLRQGSRADPQEARPGTDLAPAQGMATQFPGPCACQCCSEPGENQRTAVRSESDGHPAADRCGTLRINGHRLQSGRAESLECTLARSAGSREGIHAAECAGRPLCAERDGERLGREPHCRDCPCDHCEAHREVERLVARNSGAAEAEITWLAGIRRDLERIGYIFGACVTPAAGVGAPHIRQRLFWVADTAGSRVRGDGYGRPLGEARVGEADARQRQRLRTHTLADGSDGARGLADAGYDGHDRGVQRMAGSGPGARPDREAVGQGEGGNAWSDAAWLPCLDGKARRVESSIQPLVDARGCICGLRVGQDCTCAEKPSRVGMLRGAGNAISPPVAAVFIKAVMECLK